MAAAPPPTDRSRAVKGLAPVVDLAGFPVAFHADDERRADAVRRLLSALPGRPAPPEVVFRYRRRSPPIPDGAPTWSYQGVRVWHAGTRLTVHLDDQPAGAVADIGEVVVGGGADDPDVAWQQLFHFGATHVLAHRGRYLLHGAAVVDGEGRAYVVIGGTGQGKSTLALAALTSGWKLLADDLIVVRSDGGSIEVAGVPRRAAVPGDVDIPDELRRNPIPGDWRGRYELADGSLSPGWYPAAGIVLVGHGDAVEGHLEPLDADRAVTRVLGSFSSVTDPLLLPGWFVVAGALCRLSRWRVGHGTDPTTRVAVAAGLLQTIAVS